MLCSRAGDMTVTLNDDGTVTRVYADHVQLISGDEDKRSAVLSGRWELKRGRYRYFYLMEEAV